jgi:hypothetical protein
MAPHQPGLSGAEVVVLGAAANGFVQGGVPWDDVLKSLRERRRDRVK